MLPPKQCPPTFLRFRGPRRSHARAAPKPAPTPSRSGPGPTHRENRKQHRTRRGAIRQRNTNQPVELSGSHRQLLLSAHSRPMTDWVAGRADSCPTPFPSPHTLPCACFRGSPLRTRGREAHQAVAARRADRTAHGAEHLGAGLRAYVVSDGFQPRFPPAVANRQLLPSSDKRAPRIADGVQWCCKGHDAEYCG